MPNKETEQFWRLDVKRIVERMFPGALLPDEMVRYFIALSFSFTADAVRQSRKYSARDGVNIVPLVQRIEQLASLKFSENVYRSLRDPSVSFVLSQFDIEAIQSSVRDMGIIAFSEGCGLLLDVSEGNIEGRQRQIQFLQMAEQKIASGVTSSGSNYPRQYYYWVHLLLPSFSNKRLTFLGKCVLRASAA